MDLPHTDSCTMDDKVGEVEEVLGEDDEQDDEKDDDDEEDDEDEAEGEEEGRGSH